MASARKFVFCLKSFRTTEAAGRKKKKKSAFLDRLPAGNESDLVGNRTARVERHHSTNGVGVWGGGTGVLTCTLQFAAGGGAAVAETA